MASCDLKQPLPPFEANFLGRQQWAATTEKGICKAQSGLFEVIWIKKGTGTCRVDLHTFPITKDTLYYLSPGQLHIFDPDDEITGYRIAFAPDFLGPDFKQTHSALAFGSADLSREVPVVQLKGEIQIEVELIVRQMIWEYNDNQLLKFAILKGLLKVYIGCFSKHSELSQLPVSSTNCQVIFECFKELLEKRFLVYKLVSQYADELAITPNYLSEVVKRSSGFSASYFIHQRVILEAKRIAMTSQLSMKEIAFQIGFEDPSQFSKFFKSKTGKTFSEFRKGLPAGDSNR
ncbi:AraC family transcriptional regulator [Dyadobacter sp. CY343]|uniref:helix-turn-helix domain-containing protein n=1 Tax=Dyadobacter sp. CY343 TaxID=2907299 RepID=UPI001F1B69CE|nr:helix-turn-helix domain-containing protein [Dyadobacter sp. CY343]MCE7060225.1 AraC family transcriptional regulator [Dyadobacter sp. CY343]